MSACFYTIGFDFNGIWHWGVTKKLSVNFLYNVTSILHEAQTELYNYFEK